MSHMKDPVTEKQPRSLKDLVEVVFRHKTIAVVFFLAVTCTALVMLAFSRPSYISTSKLIVHRGSESVFINPAVVGATLPVYKSWESELNTELEILNSRELVESLVESIGPSVFLEGRPPEETGLLSPIRKLFNPVRLFFANIGESLSEESLSAEESGRQMQMNKAVQIVENRFQIQVSPKSDIIIVSYTSADPELAQQVVDELIKIYMVRRIELRQIPGGYTFFTQQTELLRKELETNANRLMDLKTDKAVNEGPLALQNSLAQLQATQMEVQVERAASAARVSKIRSMLSQQTSANSGPKSSAILDPVEYKTLQETLRSEETTLAALTAQKLELEKQIGQLRVDLKKSEKLAPSIHRLETEQELLEGKYRTYSENREQARINQELETRKISNVTVVQQATPPQESSPYGKGLKLAATMFLGFLGAIGITFAADGIDPALHSAADVSARVQRGTLVELPELHGKERDLAYRPPLRKERKSRWILHSGKKLAADGDQSFQELCLRLQAAAGVKEGATLVIGITSSIGGEGVSTVAGKLAAAFSCDERFPKVLLLDANQSEHSDQLVRARTDLPFDFYKLRDQQVAEGEGSVSLTASTVAQYLVEARQQSYQVIIMDIPPLEEGNYSVRVNGEADVIALVADSARTPWRAVKYSADLLENAGADLAGIILNRRRCSVPKWLYRKL